MLKEQYRKLEKVFPFVKILKKLYGKIPGKGLPRRYKYLLQGVGEAKARKIMEIGTYTGRHAETMIEEAKKYHPANEVEYYGFDLFEMLDKDTSAKEIAIQPSPLEAVRNKLEKTGARLSLYQGYTKDTLPKVIDALPEMDFIYIDGGHSLETIDNDWKYSQRVMGQDTIVIFDDYWNRDDSGCKKLVSQMDRNKFNVEILPIQDRFKKDWGVLEINFVKVTRKN